MKVLHARVFELKGAGGCLPKPPTPWEAQQLGCRSFLGVGRFGGTAYGGKPQTKPSLMIGEPQPRTSFFSSIAQLNRLV